MLGRFYYPLLIYSSFSLVEFLSNYKNNLLLKRSAIFLTTIIIFISPFYNGMFSKVWPLSQVSKDLTYPLTPYHYHKDIDKVKNNEFCTMGACDEKAIYLRYRFKFFKNEILNTTVNKLSKEYEHNDQLNYGNIFFGTGYSGLLSGPLNISYDNQGLTDLLQARMPYIKGTSWYPAHFTKIYPRKNGLESFLKNDKEFFDIFNSLNQISKGRIFSIKRFNEIIKQNFGLYKRDYDLIKIRYGSLNMKNCSISNREELCKLDLQNK